MSLIYDRNSGDNSENNWDDTLLIKAWDAAVPHVKLELERQQNEENGRSSKDDTKKHFRRDKKWRVNDHCTALYSEDGLLYEAEISYIDEVAGTCIVKFVGYENEEEVSLKSLMRSGGTRARDRQLKDSEEEKRALAVAEDDESDSSSMQTEPTERPSTPTASSRAERSRQQEPAFMEANGNSASFQEYYHQVSGQVPPPLPPPLALLNTEGLAGDEADAMSAMVMSWYMAGYHTGYYVSLRRSRNQAEPKEKQ
ncbi:survival motor neuron protein 1-like [Artemia franciscana]|uniref:Tudor domain-containing protein n=1 Tax=Artemia franciscana TaxID=6661 RepID=A0AA88KU10_ARTSF|nr:hypothetical protein QYM36_014803 [Artemia franciscana]